MELPDKVRYLIEALRGGGESVIDKKTGKEISHTYGKRPVMQKTGMEPSQMRGWQLYNQEQKANGEPTASYEEWIRMQGN